MKYETVIGLEVHVQLKTRTKCFCACATEFGAPPNTQVCPVCLGFPGVLPVLNRTALEYAVRAGLGLNCAVQGFTKFDRKHYYYPDLPKNYQISQYDLPVAKGGYCEVDVEGATKRFGITRVHLEEDAGKLIHQQGRSLVDLNRTGIPLLEIVSEPDMRSPLDAYEYLAALKSIVQYTGVSDCDMEKGYLRCDANISLRPAGATALGVKTELKNLNSFKAVREALAFEVLRQTQVLEEGGVIVQETRLWDAQRQVTVSMRSKEEAKDYRYFPEPDLPPYELSQAFIEAQRALLPELPRQKMQRFIASYGLSPQDAAVAVADRAVAEYAEELMKAYPPEDKKPAINMLLGSLFAEANAMNSSIAGLQEKVPAGNLAELAVCFSSGAISNLVAAQVLKEMVATGRGAKEIIAAQGLSQISDRGELGVFADEVIKANPKSVQDFHSGKENAVMFLVGQVMKRSGGKANPKVVQELLRKKLTGGG
jgi:aspartyl-tRNA(Asn)/glutamyl-tRNA(Gln) amidotransferase subunit B